MEPIKVHHLGMAVSDLEQARRIYAAMGLLAEGTACVPDQQVTVAWIPTGESRIEALQPTGPQSLVARFMEQKGPGLHHVALEVTDIEAALLVCGKEGLEPIDERPRQGAGGQVAFLHPRTTAGVLIELIQPSSAKES